MKQDKDKVEYISEDLSAEASAKAEGRIKKLKQELKFCQKERAEHLAGWQRAKADYINFKREQEQKIANCYKFANEGLILELLPVLDSFEAALKHKNDEGIKQLYNQLKNILKNDGLEEIKAVGEKFNPELHEVIETIKSDKGEGIIIEEIQRGYKLHGKVIRPSRAKISKSDK